MDLSAYRDSPSERERTADLLQLAPTTGKMALDVGARDGHFSHLLAARFEEVIALDLSKPTIIHERITCIAGNASNIELKDGEASFVFCAEVLEHIPPEHLPEVCAELQRVCSGKILIGVPYKQDIRVGRTTCKNCGKKNPPWGHVNTFDEKTLVNLFSRSKVEKISFVGRTTETTNWLSCLLMDLAGNPYGTYSQDEPCIHCGHALEQPHSRNIARKIFARLAVLTQSLTASLAKPRGNWIHILFSKN